MAEVIKFKPRAKTAKAVDELAAQAKSTRIAAIDILRGLCVAGMILVAYAGDWSHRFKVLNHADWHGLALADMIFPGFLLCVGLSIPLSLAHRAEAGKAKTAGHILWRSVAIIALGVGLNYLSGLLFGPFRIPGILQRIGLCYAVAAGLALWLARGDGKGLRVPLLPVVAVLVAVLAGYGLLLRFADMPGCGPACFDSSHSLPAVVDRMIFTTRYMWPWGLTDGQVTYDPEGLISTLGAVCNVLIGVVAGAYLRKVGVRGALATLAFAGLILFVTGAGMDSVLPLIKKIWTPSFALFSAGFGLLLFALLALITDVAGQTGWAWPLRVLGANATAAFVAISLIDMAMQSPLIAGRSGHDTLVHALDSIIPDPRIESLCYSLILLGVVMALLAPLYLKRIFLKL